jgi:hypothetical protein
MLAVAGGVLAVLVVGGIVSRALSGTSPQPAVTPTTTNPTTSPTTTPTTTTPTTTNDTGAAFNARADAICANKFPALVDGVHALKYSPTTPPSDVVTDVQTLINQLTTLGTPPVDNGSMGTALEDWQQALGDTDSQTFNIDFDAGLDQFAAMGMRVCSGGRVG